MQCLPASSGAGFFLSTADHAANSWPPAAAEQGGPTWRSHDKWKRRVAGRPGTGAVLDWGVGQSTSAYAAGHGSIWSNHNQHYGVESQSDKDGSEKRPLPILGWVGEPGEEPHLDA
jgi:hypothetical protein